ncbi:MAG TPA: elongation factor P maturation arginine rhamnosyltransferase EarP [Burkholderiaceae bacterium]|nr:elongation factor P maturation arginine rhamnosyltransferase EarP [Burkholderiaceae bacterium]
MTMPPVRWDLFCRVIDNLGDAGVCWRLAADLAARGESVRLIIDAAAPLARLAPGGSPQVDIASWHDDVALPADTDVVIEAFGCDPPTRFVEQMARSARPPCWINLEYLSAEPHAARSHGLPSPQLAGPGRGLTKWFFYPGFTPDSGGLLREPGLLQAREAFARDDWLRSAGCSRADAERVIVLFSYGHAALGRWLAALPAQPTLLLVPQGPAQRVVRDLLGASLRCGALRAQLLPWLPQDAFDRLLWSADLTVVRGEDSLVRALWAGVPFVWQLYPQRDGAHHRKLQAFLERWQADTTALPAGVAEWLAWWNADDAGALPAWPSPDRWREAVLRWREQLTEQSDLTTRLRSFVAGKR